MTASHRCPQCDVEIPPSSPAGLCPRCLLLAANDNQSVEVCELGPTRITPPESGFAPPPPEELAPLFPQLEIQELLGKGGMGAVYKARQPGLDRVVAVKILPSEISRDPKFTERFQREARALARLSHPHIVHVYDFGQTGGLCYIVMEFVDGANLREVIRRQTLTAAEALTIVHRDIKPENILIDKRGRVKIADFGLAKLLGPEGSEHSLTATQQVMGTLRYMAPEQMQGARAVDHRADIYSLGVVFYELLTGELPMGKFAPPSKKVEIDVRLDEVVLRALEQEPEQRYQHASDVKTDIESISADSFHADLHGRTAGSASKNGGRHSEGLSTFVERELSGAWRWVVGDASSPTQPPAFPGRFMLVLSLAGCLMLTMPWLDLHIEQDANLKQFWSNAELPRPFSRTLYGSERLPGIVAGVAFGLLALLLIMTPGGRPLTGARAVIMSVFAACAVVPSFFIKLDLELEGVPIPIVQHQDSRFSGLPRTSDGDMQVVGEPRMERVMVNARVPLKTIEYQIKYREGFYGSLALSVALLVLSSIGVRHAVAWGDERKAARDPRSLPVDGLPQIRRQLLGPAIALILYGLLLFGPVVLLFFNGLDIADGNDGTPAPVGFAMMAFSVLLVGMAGLVLRGAWHLLAVENYRAAWLGSFLAQPVGLWGLFVLSRSEVKAAFPTPALADSHEPRLSQHSFWGAIWAGGGVIAIAFLLIAFCMTSVQEVVVTTSETAVVTGSPSEGSPQAMMLLVLPIALLALSAPIGATTLGAVAVGRIKRSDGKLYGLRLAFADAMCYPLLLLGTATFGLVHLLQIAIWTRVYTTQRPMNGSWTAVGPDIAWRPDHLFLILDALFMVTVCYIVGVTAWRKICATQSSAEKSPPAVPAFVGTPLTQIRFTVSNTQDVTRNAIFHFSTLGYQLIEQHADVCIFQRGSKWAGLWEMDIVGMHTQLTVRTTPASTGLVWVSCDWSVRTWGGWITRRDVAKLQAEGRGLESLINGEALSDALPATGPGGIEAPALPVPRPRLVPFIAALNCAAAVIVLLVSATDEPTTFSDSVPRLWQVWEAMDMVLGFLLAAGLFAASIGLFLWKPWARRVTLAVCLFGLASFVFDVPYLARFVLPDFYAEVHSTLAAEGVAPEMLELGAMSTVVGFQIVPMVLGLVWLIMQLIYFTRPQVVAALSSPNENPNRLVEWMFSGTGAVVGVFSVFGSLLLLLGLVALFEKPDTPSVTAVDSVPPLGIITSGIGAEFTVPAGQVATFEVVTRRDNETVPVPEHCGYVLAPPDKDVKGSFRWSRTSPNTTDDNVQNWSLEILAAGVGRSYTEATLHPQELNRIVGAMSLGLGVLTPNEEVIHWGNADVNKLPADGLIGLRVTVVPHGMRSARSGNAHINWKRSQSAQSTSRRKLPVAVP